MAKTDAIRVGIVGAGGITRRRHIPGLQAIDGVEIVSVCNRSRSSSQGVAKEHSIGQVYDHWQELVTADESDAIVIGTWPYLHCPVTLAALESGKHVFTQARMAMNASEARAMLTAARRNPHLVAQVSPAPHSLPVDSTVRRLISEGHVGDVLAVDIRQGGDFIDREAPLHWRHDESLSGLNIMAMGMLYETILKWVGPATRITAMANTFVRARRADDGTLVTTTIPDHLGVLGELACGAQLSVQVSAVMGHGWSGATVYGSEATLRYKLLDDQLYSARRGDEGEDPFRPIEIPDGERGSWRAEEEFVAAIRGEETITRLNFVDGVRYMEFSEAVYRSIREQRTVAVPFQ
jgi:predicted dehydrogenase